MGSEAIGHDGERHEQPAGAPQLGGSQSGSCRRGGGELSELGGSQSGSCRGQAATQRPALQFRGGGGKHSLDEYMEGTSNHAGISARMQGVIPACKHEGSRVSPAAPCAGRNAKTMMTTVKRTTKPTLAVEKAATI